MEIDLSLQRKTKYELYNLGKDPFETKNLAESEPNKLKTMTEAMAIRLEESALYPSAGDTVLKPEIRVQIEPSLIEDTLVIFCQIRTVRGSVWKLAWLRKMSLDHQNTHEYFTRLLLEAEGPTLQR